MFSRKSMQATRRPTSLPSFSDISHLCCKILGQRSAAISGSNLVPLVSKILFAHNSGDCVSVKYSFMVWFLTRSGYLCRAHLPGRLQGTTYGDIGRTLADTGDLELDFQTFSWEVLQNS